MDKEIKSTKGEREVGYWRKVRRRRKLEKEGGRSRKEGREDRVGEGKRGKKEKKERGRNEKKREIGEIKNKRGGE